jgi:hypothetical protein
VASYDGVLVAPGVLLGMGGNLSFYGPLVPGNFDQTPPTVTRISPLGSSIGRTEAWVGLLQDTVALRRSNIWIEYPNGEWETAYAKGRFSRRFRRSTLTGGSTSQTLTLLREGGWPYGEFTVEVEPVDGGGNVPV